MLKAMQNRLAVLMWELFGLFGLVVSIQIINQFLQMLILIVSFAAAMVGLINQTIKISKFWRVVVFALLLSGFLWAFILTFLLH